MKKITISFNQLNKAITDIIVFRSYSQLSFDVALRLSANVDILDGLIKSIEPKIKLIDSRVEEYFQKEKDIEKQIKYRKQSDKDYNTITEKITLEIDFIKASDIAGISVDGDKEVPTQNGIIKMNFRDSFFGLVYLGIIEMPKVAQNEPVPPTE